MLRTNRKTLSGEVNGKPGFRPCMYFFLVSFPYLSEVSVGGVFWTADDSFFKPGKRTVRRFQRGSQYLFQLLMFCPHTFFFCWKNVQTQRRRKTSAEKCLLFWTKKNRRQATFFSSTFSLMVLWPPSSGACDGTVVSPYEGPQKSNNPQSVSVCVFPSQLLLRGNTI